jgi:hypothetical protein
MERVAQLVLGFNLKDGVFVGHLAKAHMPLGRLAEVLCSACSWLVVFGGASVWVPEIAGVAHVGLYAAANFVHKRGFFAGFGCIINRFRSSGTSR